MKEQNVNPLHYFITEELLYFYTLTDAFFPNEEKKLYEKLKQMANLLLKTKEKELIDHLLIPADLQKELRDYYSYVTISLKNTINKKEENILNIKNDILIFQSMTIVFSIIDQFNQHFSEMNPEELEESLQFLNGGNVISLGSLFYVAEKVNSLLNENKEYIEKGGVLLMDTFLREPQSEVVKKIIKCTETFKSTLFRKDYLLKIFEEKKLTKSTDFEFKSIKSAIEESKTTF